MVAQTGARAAGLGLPLEYRVGALRLGIPADTFDGCRVDRVLHHLDDPARALTELTRVARPRGRVVACEPDIDTFLFDLYWPISPASLIRWQSRRTSARIRSRTK